MPISYKIDVLEALRGQGFSSYRLRKEKIFGERTIQQLREGQPVSWEVICKLCGILGCDVGDLLTVELKERKECQVLNVKEL